MNRALKLTSSVVALTSIVTPSMGDLLIKINYCSAANSDGTEVVNLDDEDSVIFGYHKNDKILGMQRNTFIKVCTFSTLALCVTAALARFLADLCMNVSIVSNTVSSFKKGSRSED